MSIFETNAPAQQGARATETAHRKIELQAPADLTYLIAKVSRTAEEKLDKHLPPDAVAQKEKQGDESGKTGGEGVEEDEMRKRVRGLVEEVSLGRKGAASFSSAARGCGNAPELMCPAALVHPRHFRRGQRQHRHQRHGRSRIGSGAR